MFDNSVFENLILKKDVEELSSYLKDVISSGNSNDIFSSAKAVYFCILKTNISMDFITEIKEERFIEMMRRMLFCYIRNNPPSDVRQKARKVLISMGFLAVEASEAMYSPLVWNFYETFYRYKLTDRPKVFSKLVKLLSKTRDSYTRDSAVKFVKEFKEKESKSVEALIDYFKIKENSSIKEVYEFLDKCGVAPIDLETEKTEPVVEKTEPVAEKTESVSEKIEPVAEKTEPVAEKTEPVVEKTEPVAEKIEPVSEKTEPVAEKTEPVAEKTEPVAEKIEPVAEKIEPVSEKIEPVAEKAEPVVEKTEPVSEKIEPVSEKTEPVSEKTEPVSEKTEPVPAVQPLSENCRVLKSSYVSSSKSVLIPPPKVELPPVEPVKVELPPVEPVKVELTTVEEFKSIDEPKVESKLIKEVSKIKKDTVEKDKTELPHTPRELKDALKVNFVDIKSAGNVDVSPTLVSKTIEMLLELIKVGSDHDMRFVENSINNYFVSDSFMQDALRRELKIFMSDSDLPEFVSKRAMDFLPLLGKTKQKQSLSSILMSISDLEEEEKDYSDETTSSTIQLSIEEDLSRTVSERVFNYLKSSDSYETRLENCKKMIEDGMSFEEYKDLIDFDLPKSGKRYFDRVIPAAKAILFSNKFEYQEKAEEARFILFVSLFYLSCPDILKMECFETLKRCGYLDIATARNIYKQYAIVFVKDALLNKSSGAACRALSDMISILVPGAIGRENFEGKNIEFLIDNYVSLILKEKDEKLFNYAVDILNHLSFEEHSVLLPLSVRIQPVNYEKAIDVTEMLVNKRNIWASSILVDAVGENYMDIRNKAVESLSRCGAKMPIDYRRRAVNLIFEKLDVAYDEEKQAQYIEAARNIDSVVTGGVLISLFANSGLTDRKEIGNRLMGTLAIMSSNEFLELFKGMDNLKILYNYLITSHRDKFTVDFARQFIDLYRIHFSNANGEETWTNILSETNSEFVDMINNLWNLQFQN